MLQKLRGVILTPATLNGGCAAAEPKQGEVVEVRHE